MELVRTEDGVYYRFPGNSEDGYKLYRLVPIEEMITAIVQIEQETK